MVIVRMNISGEVVTVTEEDARMIEQSHMGARIGERATATHGTERR